MEHFLLILGAISLCVGEPVKRLNVFLHAALGQLMYEEIHKTQSHNDDRHPITDPELKEEMCHYVTGSKLFSPSEYERIFMYEIYDELRTEYEDIFNQLYVDRTEPSVEPFDRDKIYVNPTEEITVFNPWNNTRHLESVFVCLVRYIAKGSGTLEKFYISGEYNVRDSRNAVGPHIAGRFVFGHDKIYKQLTIFGFFEEPAKVLSASIPFLENLYLRRMNVIELDLPSLQIIIDSDTKTRKQKWSSWLHEQEKCPTYLSELHDYEMERLCNIAMKSSHFENHTYSTCRDVKEYCHQSCARMYVSFRTPEARVTALGKYYIEWTLRCCMQDKTGESFWYHISKANESITEVFVFRETGEHEMVLENLSTNVRFTVPFLDKILN